MISAKSARNLLYCMTAFYALTLITLTHLPLEYVMTEELQQQSRIYWMDKIVHVVLYSGFTTLLFLCINPVEYDEITGDLVILPGQILILSLQVVLLALLDELTQPYFGRTFEVLDFAADFAAIFPGASLFLVIQLMRQSIRQKS